MNTLASGFPVAPADFEAEAARLRPGCPLAMALAVGATLENITADLLHHLRAPDALDRD